MTKEQLSQLLSARAQASALVRQFHILSAQVAALHAQMEALAHGVADDIVETSGGTVVERIFKSEARHFMEPTDAESREGNEQRPRSDPVQVRAAGHIGGRGNGEGHARRQRGSVREGKSQGGVTD